jgi:stage V sporulation protein AA
VKEEVSTLTEQASPTVYIRLRKRIRLEKGNPIYLGQVADLLAEPPLDERLKRIVLYRPREVDGNHVLIDMMLVVRKIKDIWPRAAVELFGEPHTVVEIAAKPRAVNRIVLVLTWVLLFIGSGLAIMNFHTDVSMPEVHRKLFTMITGEHDEHPLTFQIPYSIGIGVGMILFFNRLFKKKFNEEPNPLEVELFMYEESVQQYVISDEYEKKRERDDA